MSDDAYREMTQSFVKASKEVARQSRRATEAEAKLKAIKAVTQDPKILAIINPPKESS